MKRIISYIILALIFSVGVIQAQSITDAERLFNEKKFKESAELYEKLVKTSSKDALLQYKAGKALYMAGEYERAIPRLEYAVSKKYQSACQYLADAYFRLYLFDKAIENYNIYLERFGEKLEDTKSFTDAIERAKTGTSMLKRVEDIAIADSIKYNKRDFLDAYTLNKDFGELGYAVDMHKSADSTATMFTTGKGDRMIYASEKDSALCLFTSYQLIDGWSKPTLLSKELTTTQDENYPFMLSDGITLYFASKGFNSLGGYDIYMTRYNSATNSYTTPQNIGMPFNSPANDYMMVIDEMTNIGWFATDRNQHEDSVVIYTFIPNSAKILIQDTTQEFVLKAAKLERYRKGELPKRTINNDKIIYAEDKTKESVIFVVSDQIKYRRAEEFKNEEAKKLYYQLKQKEEELKEIEDQLNEMRNDYAQSETDADKQELINTIIKLESDLAIIKHEIKDMTYDIRYHELHELQNSKE